MKWLGKAETIMSAIMEHYADEEKGGFYFTSDLQERHIVRTRSFYDSALPSGSGSAINMLQRLYGRTDKKEYLEAAELHLKSFLPEMRMAPRAVLSIIQCIGKYLDLTG